MKSAWRSDRAEIDYHFAQHASRREGVKFKMASKPSRRPNAANNCKLTWDVVRRIRRYAAQEGYGLPMVRQVEALSAQVSVSHPTLVEVLTNRSWYDPTYEPKAPDLEYWRGVAPAVLLMRVLAGSRRNEI